MKSRQVIGCFFLKHYFWCGVSSFACVHCTIRMSITFPTSSGRWLELNWIGARVEGGWSQCLALVIHFVSLSHKYALTWPCQAWFGDYLRGATPPSSGCNRHCLVYLWIDHVGESSRERPAGRSVSANDRTSELNCNASVQGDLLSSLTSHLSNTQLYFHPTASSSLSSTTSENMRYKTLRDLVSV